MWSMKELRDSAIISFKYLHVWANRFYATDNADEA